MVATKYLVGGLEHFLFFHILGIIIPTDEIIFFRGAGLNHQPDIVSPKNVEWSSRDGIYTLW